jgi:hypothetical protein
VKGAVEIIKLPTDPVCTRVSAGGNEKFGYYCRYRGTREEAIRALEMALFGMKAARFAGVPELPVADQADPHIGRS